MFYNLEAGQLDWRQAYHLCIGFIQPRPIGWVSTISPEGKRNLAPFSFYNMVSANPPVVFFSAAMNRHGQPKDTLRNVETTREFVVATATVETRQNMVDSAANLPYGESEFEFARLTPRPASLVKPSLVGESPVNIECRLHDVVRIGEGGGAAAVVFGRIVAIHVDPAVLAADGSIDPHKLHTVGRLGGQYYCDVTRPYELHIPKVPPAGG
jgi:flavin reductase (DIM6/NTAB) family NADH-FMN oxidoreductase RutF